MTDTTTALAAPPAAGVTPDVNPGPTSTTPRPRTKTRELRMWAALSVVGAVWFAVANLALPARAITPEEVQALAVQTLAEQPGSAGVHLDFDQPLDQEDWIAQVRLSDPGTIQANPAKLADDPDRIEYVIRHELAHIYQARLAHEHGQQVVLDRLDEIFTSTQGVEDAADCVAIALGSDPAHARYNTDCASDAKQAAVTALLEGRMP